MTRFSFVYHSIVALHCLLLLSQFFPPMAAQAGELKGVAYHGLLPAKFSKRFITRENLPSDKDTCQVLAPDFKARGKLAYSIDIQGPLYYSLYVGVKHIGSRQDTPPNPSQDLLYRFTGDVAEPAWWPDGKRLILRGGGNHDFYRNYFSPLLFDTLSEQLYLGPPDRNMSYRRMWWPVGGNYTAYVTGGDISAMPSRGDEDIQLKIYDWRSGRSRVLRHLKAPPHVAWVDNQLLFLDSFLPSKPGTTYGEIASYGLFAIGPRDAKSRLILSGLTGPISASADGKWLASIGLRTPDEISKKPGNSELELRKVINLDRMRAKKQPQGYVAQEMFLHVSSLHGKEQFVVPGIRETDSIQWLSDNTTLVCCQGPDVTLFSMSTGRSIKLALRPQILSPETHKSVQNPELMTSSRNAQFLYFRQYAVVGYDSTLPIINMYVYALDVSDGSTTLLAKVGHCTGIDYYPID